MADEENSAKREAAIPTSHTDVVTAEKSFGLGKHGFCSDGSDDVIDQSMTSLDPCAC